MQPSAVLETLSFAELRRPAPPDRFELASLRDELDAAVATRLAGASRVAVCAGSRGVARVGEVVACVVESLSAQGKTAVLVPAMGSHGGASAEGQVHVLAELGIDAATLGVEIAPSMAARAVGELASGEVVYLAEAVLDCDAVLPVNRVKPHTDFRGPLESGLVKMLTIGLGKELGASSLHAAGFDRFHEILPAAAGIVLEAVDVAFGVALLEDAWHRLRRAELVAGSDLLDREPQLLQEAWQHFPRLPFAEVDLLVLAEIGKTISGAGMDPNVTGRWPNTALQAPTKVNRLAVLDLRDDSGGNAIGVGMADVVTNRLAGKIDWPATAANALASKSPGGARLPLVAPSDVEAISMAAASMIGHTLAEAGVAVARNTLALDHLAVTAPLLAEATAAGYEVVRAGVRAELAGDGTIERIGSLELFPPS